MNIFLIVLGGASGAVITFLLQKYGVSAVIASSLVGLSGALVGFLISNTHLPAVVFAGSFVGMTALHMASLPLIIIAGVGVGLLYSVSLNILPGYGGRLGAIAFIITVAVIWVSSFFGKK
ncbi:MAG: hypothetical protein AAB465_01640 [Patescibacteria group bacterium]